MKSFKLKNGQFQFDGQNALAMVDEDDELMQCIQQTITTQLGEWFLNPTIGWNRFNTLGRKPSEERSANDIIAAILTSEPRVASVDNVNVTFNEDGRGAKITYIVTKQDSTELAGEATI